MDFDLSEEQEMLRKAARDFLEKECLATLVRQMEDDEKGYSPDLWRKMAGMGWMGLLSPEKYGGSGMNFVDFAILLEEMGRALVPGPFLSTVLCGLAILSAGTEAQRREFLPKIAKGELIMALALTEASASFDPTKVAVRATPRGDNYVINGTKLFIGDAHVADYLLCVTRTKGGGGKEGITLFLVDGKSSGISYTALDTYASDKQFEVVFNKVAVPKGNMLGQLDGGYEMVQRLLEQGVVAECALILGLAYKVLEMSVEYSKERVQFGQPIGSFQAIQHRAADMSIDCDGSRFVTWQAAWKLSQGLSCALEASLAKGWVSDACRRVCDGGLQIHGGAGLMMEHDLQLYFRRGKAHELSFGDSTHHRQLVAQLGL